MQYFKISLQTLVTQKCVPFLFVIRVYPDETYFYEKKIIRDELGKRGSVLNFFLICVIVILSVHLVHAFFFPVGNVVRCAKQGAVVLIERQQNVSQIRIIQIIILAV